MVSKYEDYEFSSYNEFVNKSRLITDRAIELIFGTCNNFIKTYEKIHKDRIIEDIKEVQEFVDKNIIIKEFLEYHNKSMDEITEDRTLLKKLLIQLKNRSGISLRKLGIMFEIGKDTISKIIKE